MKPFALVAEVADRGDSGLECGLSMYRLDIGSCLIGGSEGGLEPELGKDNDRNWLGCRREKDRTEVGLLSTLPGLNVELRGGVVLGFPIFDNKFLS